MTGNANGITERLVDYTLGLKYEDIPPEVIERTKQLFLDFLGGAVGGRTLAESNTAVVRGAAALAADTPGACTVLGEQRQFPAHLAALLNGTFAHSMDFDDTHKEAVTHPGTPLFAALLAVAEQTGASGRDLLTAAIAGYDVGCKLAILHSDRVHMRGFHPTATTGIFACTMAAGRLLGLSRDALLNAVALNLSQAAGSVQFSETGGANKPLQVGPNRPQRPLQPRLRPGRLPGQRPTSGGQVRLFHGLRWTGGWTRTKLPPTLESASRSCTPPSSPTPAAGTTTRSSTVSLT